MKAIKKIILASVFALLFLPLSHAQISFDVGGYMQTWYTGWQQTESFAPDGTIETSEVNGFRIRRSRITARGRINDTFSATTWFEFSGPNNNLLDFHFDANIYPWLNIRAGQFIMPGQTFDTARLVSSQLAFYERPQVTTRLASVMGYDAFRDIGVMVYGQHGRLWYGIHAGNGAGRFTQAGNHITKRDAFGGLYGFRMDYELIDGLTLGGHLSTNQQRNVVQRGSDPFDRDRTSWSLRMRSDGLLLSGLFTQFEYASLAARDDSRFDLHGFYGEAGYRITPDWHVLGRYDYYLERPEAGGRLDADTFTFGITRYVRHEGREILRTHLNYSFGESSPGDLSNSILVLVVQVRFIPI